MIDVTTFMAPAAEYILFIIRIVVGITILYYGLPKLLNLKQNAQDFRSMGFKPGWFWGTIIALVEGVGGILLILGLLIPVVAVFFGFHMLVGTIWKITSAKKPFTDWSYDILLLIIMVFFLVMGSGAWAINPVFS